MPASYRDCGVLDFTLSAAGTQTDVTISRPMVISDVTIKATATQAGGTITMQRQALGAGAFNAITDAIVCATANAVTRAGTINDAQAVMAATDVLRAVVNGAATNGRVQHFVGWL